MNLYFALSTFQIFSSSLKCHFPFLRPHAGIVAERKYVRGFRKIAKTRAKVWVCGELVRTVFNHRKSLEKFIVGREVILERGFGFPGLYQVQTGVPLIREHYPTTKSDKCLSFRHSLLRNIKLNIFSL